MDLPVPVVRGGVQQTEDVLRWLAHAMVRGGRDGRYRCPSSVEGISSRRALALAREREWVRSPWWSRRGLRRAFRFTPEGTAVLARYIEDFGGVWGGADLPAIAGPTETQWRASTLALGLRPPDLRRPLLGWLPRAGEIMLWGEASLTDARRTIARWPRAVRRRVVRGEVRVAPDGEIDPLAAPLSPREREGVRGVVMEGAFATEQAEEIDAAWARVALASPTSRAAWQAAVATDAAATPKVRAYLLAALDRVPRFTREGPPVESGRGLVLSASTEPGDGVGGWSPWEWVAAILAGEHPERLCLALADPAPRVLHGLGGLAAEQPSVRTVVLLSDPAAAWFVPTALSAHSPIRLVAHGSWAATRHVLDARVLPRGSWCVPGRFVGSALSRDRVLVLGAGAAGHVSSRSLRRLS